MEDIVIKKILLILLIMLLFTPSAQADTIDPSFVYETTSDREICFNASSSRVPAGIKTLLWDFGDGHESNEMDPCHTYSLFVEPSRDFMVSLSIIDGENEENTIYRKVTVQNQLIWIAIGIIFISGLLIKVTDWKDVKRRLRA